jgi:signal transduction histidine kinase
LKERGRFIEEIQTFTPPAVLIHVPKTVVPSSLLFDEPVLRGSTRSKDVFSTKLQGEFAPGEDYWQALSQAADWIVEIDTSIDARRVRYNIAPTKTFLADSPEAKPSRLTIDHPYPDSKLSFQARILIKEGSSGTKPMKAWAGNAYGIRVFLEGFRVLPYGEKSNDWLSLDLDYAQRTRKSVWLEALSLEDETSDEDALLVHLPNRSYFGGIFLTVEGSHCLRMLVNREGFVPDSTYDALVKIVRVGIDLATRARAAAKSRIRQERKEQRSGKPTGSPGATSRDLPVPLTTSVARARELVHDARQMVARGEVAEAQKAISVAEAQFEDISDRLSTEGSMLRVLASVGTQMGAFVHEINALLGMAESLEAALSRIAEELALSREQRREIAKVQQSVADLRRHLERQASYLVDVVTPDSRRRRTRMSLADRFDAGKRLVEHIADRRGIRISNEIPPSVKSPPMFPAELTTVFSNLLTNAVKAAGDNGKIRAWAQQGASDATVIVENTGAEVKPDDGERWFLPFESTTASVEAVLGQGMGLGLPITRSILEQYGADIRFAPPSRGYATALKIAFPNK